MKSSVLSLIFIFTVPVLAMNQNFFKNQLDYNNPPSFEWAKKIGGSGADIINGMTVDENGNFFIAGNFSGKTSFELSEITSVGLSDGFLAKLNSALHVEWIRQISGSSGDGKVFVKAIAIDNDDNLIIAGTFTSPTLIIGNITLYGSGTMDFFIAKYNNSGIPLWAENIEVLNTANVAGKIISDDPGNLYVRASSNTIYKFSPFGDFLWESENVMLIGDFNIRNSILSIAGSFWQSITLGSSYLTTTAHGICMAQINTSDGFYQNAELLATSSATINYRQPVVKSFLYDNAGNLYLSGYFYNELSCGSFSITETALNYSSFIAKTTNANCQWLIATESYGTNYISAMALDSFQNPVITGSMSDDLTIGGIQLDYIYNGFSAELNAINGDISWAGSHPYAATMLINSSDIYYSGSYQFNGFIRRCNSNGNLISMKAFAGDSGSGNIQAIETDVTGVYILGSVNCVGDFFGITHAAAKSELAIAKLNHNGTMIWHHFVENAAPQNEAGGNALILDKVNSRLTFIASYNDTITIGNQTFYSSGETRNFIAQYSTEGDFRWAYDLGACYSSCVAADNAGNVIVSGIFTGTFQLEGYTLISVESSEDIFLLKFTSGGQLDWMQRAGGEDTEWEGLVSVDAQANIYLTGEFYSVNVDFNGQYPITLNDGDGHILITKYTPTGNVLWVKSYGGSTIEYEEYSSWPCAIKTDASGNSYIHGWFGLLNIFGNITLTSPYYNNYFVAKFDGNGDVIWVKPILESQYGFNYTEIDIDEDGNCYSSGQIRDTCYFGDIMVESQSGYNDLFMAKYSSANGTLEWIKTITGISSSQSWVYGVAVYNKNSLYMGGRFSDIYNFDNITLDSRGGTNGYIGLLGQNIQAIYDPDQPGLFNIHVYPNPASSIINLAFELPCPDHYRVEIYTLSGQMVYIRDFVSTLDEPTINLSNLASGTYIVKVKTGNLTEVRKLVLD
jgi:hypothetical protein